MIATEAPPSTRGIEYKWQAAIVVVLGLFLSVLDNTIVSVALPDMRRAFNTDFDTVTWVATAYFLAQAAVIPVTGYLSDRQGTKAVFVSALAVFLAGSLLCVLAPAKEALIAARVIQGFGGGALMPTSFAIAYRAFPRDEWGRATTVIGVPVLLAPVLGPVVGGLLTSAFDWRAIFAINLPIGGVGLLLAIRLLRNRSQDLVPGSESPKERFDVLGFLLSMAGFTTLVYGLTEAGIKGWSDATADRAGGIGVVLLLALVAVELSVRAPVLDVRLFANGTFARANLLLWVVVAGFYGTLFLIPFFYESVQGTSALTAGEIMIGQGIASAAGIALGGELYNRLGPRPLVTVGTICLAISMIGFTHLALHTTGLSLQFWMVLRGLGLGLSTIPLQNLALSVVRHRDVSRASSLVNVMRQVVSAAGLAALTAYVTQRSITHVTAMTVNLQTSRVPGACAGIAPGGLPTCIRHDGIVMGLNEAFWVVLIVCAVSILLALLVGRDPSLVVRQTMDTDALAEVFPYLSKLELVEVMCRMQPRTYAPGAQIVRQGDAPAHFYIIAGGEVLVTARGDDGEERELRVMGPGDFFGEIGLLAERPRTATVTAAAVTHLLCMDRDSFAELVTASAPTAQDLRDTMWERLAAVP